VIMSLEGSGKLKKAYYLIGNWTRDLTVCNLVSQPTTISRAQDFSHNNTYIILLSPKWCLSAFLISVCATHFSKTSNELIWSLITFQDEYKVWSASLCCLLHVLVSFPVSCRNILLGDSFLRILQYKSGIILHLGHETEFLALREK
jgi:hypothetical protein